MTIDDLFQSIPEADGSGTVTIHGKTLALRPMTSWSQFRRLARETEEIMHLAGVPEYAPCWNGRPIPMDQETVAMWATVAMCVTDPPMTWKDAAILSERDGAAFGQIVAAIGEMNRAGDGIPDEMKAARGAIEQDPFPASAADGGPAVAPPVE